MRASAFLPEALYGFNRFGGAPRAADRNQQRPLAGKDGPRVEQQLAGRHCPGLASSRFLEEGSARQCQVVSRAAACKDRLIERFPDQFFEIEAFLLDYP
jgi:hypothetical protein